MSTNGNTGVINISGHEYMTVAKRIKLAHENATLEGIETEVLSHNPIVIRAKVIIDGHTYMGTSSVTMESTNEIERQNPYEVAETSAVGRALGFAGYGLLDSIASANDMLRNTKGGSATSASLSGKTETNPTTETELTCAVCGAAAVERKGITKMGKPYHAIFCSTENKSHTKWLT